MALDHDVKHSPNEYTSGLEVFDKGSSKYDHYLRVEFLTIYTNQFPLNIVQCRHLSSGQLNLL